MKYSNPTLEKVLLKHGHKPIRMTPEWCLFALQILIVEKLDKLTK